MTVQKMEAIVYYSHTRKRRYFSKNAAIKGEANARIYKKYPLEQMESESGRVTYPGYDIAVDHPEFYRRAIRYLTYLLKKNT
ncbi:hypothetical protein QPK14_21320 [Photorhabdus temperata subsp. temperata]|uniref:Uncharacterized protein n=1 Tax=Photorhabdus cinerea TaxID=471575 RepID=A0A7X5QHK7_9GAMM|nr:hypothetical protein [Photorhabdus cinerea]NHB94483.1 hypothetical protein [Photorhabdus cinerea]